MVCVDKGPSSKRVLESCPNIRFVSVLATGYNVIDCRAAAEKGIPVSNVPTYGTAAVAQFAIALLLEVCHHVAQRGRRGRRNRDDAGHAPGRSDLFALGLSLVIYPILCYHCPTLCVVGQ